MGSLKQAVAFHLGQTKISLKEAINMENSYREPHRKTVIEPALKILAQLTVLLEMQNTSAYEGEASHE